jgi:hypothetical protein
LKAHAGRTARTRKIYFSSTADPNRSLGEYQEILEWIAGNIFENGKERSVDMNPSYGGKAGNRTV